MRHPCERGSLLQRRVTAAMRCLLDHRFWAKRPAPFSKREEGRQRREERRFKRRVQTRMFPRAGDGQLMEDY